MCGNLADHFICDFQSLAELNSALSLCELVRFIDLCVQMKYCYLFFLDGYMPSKLLSQISQQIERNQGPDSFSKFYMYAGLLNMAAIRKSGVNFFDTLPKYNGNSLNVGIIDGDFNQLVHNFQQKFEPAQQSLLALAKKTVINYFRKGQLADLAFIVDKMLTHMGTHPLMPTDPTNKAIYDGEGFTQEIQSLLCNYIRVISDKNHAVLKRGDSYVNAGLALAVAALGVGILVVSLSLGALSFGAVMVAVGLYSAYTFVRQSEQLLESLTESLRDAQDAGNNIIRGDNNFKTFIEDSVIVPTVYGIFVIDEQIARKPAENREEHVRTQIQLVDRETQTQLAN